MPVWITLRKLLLGNPIETSRRLEHRLPNFLALPVFASDALSSVAYGPEEILIVLAAGGLVAMSHLLLPITFAIAALMVIVGISYRQTIHYYPGGGGSYSVAKDNLGVLPGLTSAASLTIDYILTVAVSVSAGVAALTSALPQLFAYRVEFCLLVVLIITVANLRGVKESGYAFALPTYSFIAIMMLLVVVSFYHIVTNTIPEVKVYPVGVGGIGLFMILKAFSNGCSAMTGVEAVSNGITAFRPPETTNASKTLFAMVSILVTMFVGICISAHFYGIIPCDKDIVTSQLARANFGDGFLYVFSQFATLAILCVAANTSYADFPRLAGMVARDGYAPKLFANLGDRLVHNWGIVVLAIVSSLLIIHFKATTNSLIPLYAVGVFLCFTLSQAGMVRKMVTMHEPGWLKRACINGTGAVTTGIVCLVITVSKFRDGAWIVALLIPLMILLLLRIKGHYEWFDEVMTLDPNEETPLCRPQPPLTVLVLVSSDIHRGILEGIEAGRMLAAGRDDAILRAVHVEVDHDKTKRLTDKWDTFVKPHDCAGIKLDIVPSPYRRLVEPLMEYLDQVDVERTGDKIVVVLPEFETGSLLTKLLHNFTGYRLRNALLNRRNVLVLYDRYFMR